MKRFCVRQMRREYRGVTQICFASLVILLLAFAFLGIGMHITQVDMQLRLLLMGLNPVAVLAFIGVYYVLTDEKNLIRKTPFGQAITALGEPREIMRQIDESAMKRYEPYGLFALLDGWLIIYYAKGWKYERQRMCAYPLRRESVRAVEVLPAYDPNDPEKRTVRLVTSEGVSNELTVFQQQAVDALRDWLKEQEQRRNE